VLKRTVASARQAMFKRILVPVDPSRPFDAANKYAVDLAHRFGSKMVAAYIIDEQLLGTIGDEAATSLDHALEWVGQDAMDDFVRAHPEIEMQKCLAYGPTATALFQVVLQSGADLVVVGGYHPTAAGAVWGSTVSDVVLHAERPIFVVRRRASLPQPGQNIVVPFDGSERPMLNLKAMARFAAELGAGIDLVYVARPKETEAAKAVLEKGLAVLTEFTVPGQTHILARSWLQTKARMIHQHALATKSPLIAISRLGKSSLRTGRSRTVAWLAPVWVVRK
jgi:nucleotide-binding universal stress UspA family protein